MSFSVASYNVLATAYIQRAWYSRTPALLLNPAWRVPALAQYIAKLNADILCLQEVEPDTLAPLRASLGGSGYGLEYARKRNNRPDGCAILYRQSLFQLIESRAIVFADGGGLAPDTGYVALMVTLQNAKRILQVIDTHLTWDPPGTPRQRQLGYRQMQQLLREQEQVPVSAAGCIICGDFNVTRDSEVVTLIESAGLQHAHRAFDRAYTCNANQNARTIDYIFFSPSLEAEPLLPERVDNHTVLPSAEQPSDHVPIISKFDWLD
jgi:mRNA deadenylase 3'-5' endonuclease subunit Ccr4